MKKDDDGSETFVMPDEKTKKDNKYKKGVDNKWDNNFSKIYDKLFKVAKLKEPAAKKLKSTNTKKDEIEDELEEDEFEQL